MFDHPFQRCFQNTVIMNPSSQSEEQLRAQLGDCVLDSSWFWCLGDKLHLAHSNLVCSKACVVWILTLSVYLDAAGVLMAVPLGVKTRVRALAACGDKV